ncbi:hypothetical protein [Mycolicibacterium llatzerense]|uniref:hypothetical protein n=1 Tax=Mycolicibacterium llatzerense TaxID=280871 RepID=UPI0021B52515|nr:hypothetical protein [Mycolicibacterium llatzerense]MCT7372019.1 hypothetical protein [Mycolicibacterium llatzerense]
MTTTAQAGWSQPGARIVSTGFGVLMVAAAAVGTHGPAAVVSMAALAAVGAGLLFRVAATAAVLLTVVALALSDAAPVVAALSGLSAATYLLMRHAAGTNVVTMTRPTVVSMIGFTLAGLAALEVNIDIPWLPLLAPPAAIAIYVLVLVPYAKVNAHTAIADATESASIAGVGSLP